MSAEVRTTDQLLARVGHVSIGCISPTRWFASGFAKTSNRDLRGYGPTARAALFQLVKAIEAEEARAPK